MSGESELLRQQIDTTSIQLDAANVAIPTERAARESAEATKTTEATAREGTGGRSEKQQGYRCQAGTSLIMIQSSMRAPKFNGRSQLHVWSRKCLYFWSARGSIETLEPTSNPIRIAGGVWGMEERNQSVFRHGQRRAEKCEEA